MRDSYTQRKIDIVTNDIHQQLTDMNDCLASDYYNKQSVYRLCKVMISEAIRSYIKLDHYPELHIVDNDITTTRETT